MSNIKSFIALFILIVAAHAAQGAQASCAAVDPNRMSALLTGGGAWGEATFVVDREGGRLHYRLNAGNAGSAELQRGNSTVATLNGAHGSVAIGAALLEELLRNASAFFVNAGSMRGQLNGRGSVLITGELAMNSSGARGTPTTDVASNATGVFSIGFVEDDPAGDTVRVDFDVLTDSIDGMDTTTLVLVSGSNSEDVLDLVTVEGLVDGRLHGSTRLHRTELLRLLADPTGYQLQFRSPNDGLFSGAVVDAVTTFIPAFGRTANAYGHQFRSDLRLTNPGSRPANVFIQFYPAGATSALAGRAALVRLAPGQSRTIDDAVHALFGSSSAMGSLRIVASSHVVADSEISTGSTARFGQLVSGLRPCDATTQGVLTALSVSRAANGVRTNVLIGNAGTRAANARFELRDTQGRLLDSRVMRLDAHAHLLMPLNGANGLFPNAADELQDVSISMTADTPLFLGASLIQNNSGDGRFTAARDVTPLFQP